MALPMALPRESTAPSCRAAAAGARAIVWLAFDHRAVARGAVSPSRLALWLPPTARDSDAVGEGDGQGTPHL